MRGSSQPIRTVSSRNDGHFCIEQNDREVCDTPAGPNLVAKDKPRVQIGWRVRNGRTGRNSARLKSRNGDPIGLGLQARPILRWSVGSPAGAPFGSGNRQPRELRHRRGRNKYATSALGCVRRAQRRERQFMTSTGL
jgi:hypothetical protein